VRPLDGPRRAGPYDLRREADIRKARNWWLGFWPESTDDIVKIATALGSQENAWLRQVGGYWEMAASFVLHGTLNRELFLEPSFSGEMFVFLGKVEPLLKEVREQLQNPAIGFDHIIDMGQHFFTKTRWTRTFRVIRGYSGN
jgi:hypothetical protein